ncbi:ATP-binding protein [Actinocorallia populi]|uniref:ATP-binding protein n=1 Tax=Actinocorallia populi TaxID=2079200 RepID=UPI000D090EC8|nr:ATP-binding protein [Actinocorallia populi]
MEHLSLLAFVCASIAFFAVSLVLVRQRRLTARLEEESALLAAKLTARDQALNHLVAVGLPQVMASPGHPPAAPHRGLLHQTDFARDLDAVTGMFASAADGIRSHADKSAKGTLRTMMRTVQSLANEQQVVITEMQRRHDDPAVLEDLLRIDHMNAQLGRRVQATAVLCGSWPGLQRQASSLDDVVRGATSRIRDYLRIKIYAEPNVAVVSRAVEPVVLAVAELLDNAARHSQPSTPVEVNFQTTHNGLAIMIDDAGVAMDAEELQHAAELLDGRRSVDVHRLGDPPQIGFAAIGVLAARYGFRVSVDSRSPYGGVRAVVFLPSELLTAVTREAPPRFEAVPAAPVLTSGGLPKRRRQEAGEAGEPVVSLSAPAEPARPEPSRQKAAGLGAWQRGTRSGRAGSPSASEEKDQR